MYKTLWYVLRATLRDMAGAGARMRATLTIFGIAFGVAAVIAVFAIGEGGEMRVDSELQVVGTNRAWYYPAGAQDRALTRQDAQWLQRHMSEMAGVSASATGRMSVHSQWARADALTIGCMSTLPTVEKLDIDTGRFFTDAEEQSAVLCAVVERNLAQALFPGRDPVGQTVTLAGRALTIVGLAGRHSTAYGSGAVYVPLRVYTAIANTDRVDEISVSASNDQSQASMWMLGQSLLEQRTRGGIRMVSLQSEREMADQILDIFKTVIFCVAVVALIVGGIGIMNIMFMSVRERVREIGVRMALGATPGRILALFLREAVVMSLAGGLVGIVAGVGLTLAASRYAQIPFIIPAYAVLTGLLFSVMIGLLFSLAPALRAARMLPVLALRADT